MEEKEKISSRIVELYVDIKKMYQSDFRAKRKGSSVRKFENVSSVLASYYS